MVFKWFGLSNSLFIEFVSCALDQIDQGGTMSTEVPLHVQQSVAGV
jgi:hypothetical protein